MIVGRQCSARRHTEKLSPDRRGWEAAQSRHTLRHCSDYSADRSEPSATLPVSLGSGCLSNNSASSGVEAMET